MAKKRSSSSKSGAAKRRKGPGGQQPKRFPLQQIHELLKSKFPSGVVKPEAAVFLTAILEYLSVEFLELSANVARSRERDGDKLTVTLQDTLSAIKSDPEITELLEKVKKKG
ncbi:histone H2A [Trichonephila inaurata madagascariensis]|uniref:Histone H2A n=1 Tax=Trichonephila inaurata madagascariensis TaxID=2747483 RepID=A0A8X6M8K0_9ARAC|nr:histone H2A [Trichonephila inaurata madagascariensis]